MKNANESFGSHGGSENLYRHNMSRHIYTDGVRDLARSCSAYWLIDLITSHQLHQKVMSEPFQVWQLGRVNGDAFNIICTDGNEVTRQEIPFSDFPYDVATIWLVDGCIMLPSEY